MKDFDIFSVKLWLDLELLKSFRKWKGRSPLCYGPKLLIWEYSGAWYQIVPKLEFLGGIRVEGKERLWLKTKGRSDLSGFVLEGGDL